jgi:protein DJ-1
MPKALILIADGSEEIEFVTVYDGMFATFLKTLILELKFLHVVLTRAGFEVKSVGVDLENKGWAL